VFHAEGDFTRDDVACHSGADVVVADVGDGVDAGMRDRAARSGPVPSRFLKPPGQRTLATGTVRGGSRA
jgi:hypothetical protein